VRGGDGSGRWREAKDGATGRRRISARGEAGRLGAVHQRGGEAGCPGGGASARLPGATSAARRRLCARWRRGGPARHLRAHRWRGDGGFRRGSGGLQSRRRWPPGAAAAPSRRGDGGLQARGVAGVGAPPNPSPSRPLGWRLLGRPVRPKKPAPAFSPPPGPSGPKVAMG